MDAKNPLDRAEVANNPEPRCPCVLLLDTSGSMAGERIDALNQGLQSFSTEIRRHPLTARRIEVAVITFDSEVRLAQRFVTAERFNPPTLSAVGQTSMGAGIDSALTLVESRKVQYRRHGLPYYRPWVFMITDGKSEGESESVLKRAAQRLREDEAARRVALFAVGVADADIDCLREIVVREPQLLEGLEFKEMFLWLSASMQAISQSQPGEQVILPRVGWTRRIALFVERNEDVIRDGVAIAKVVARATLGA